MPDYADPSVLGIEPLLELDPSGGQVVVTRFDCPNLRTLVVLLALHARVKRHVRRQAQGFIGVTTLIDWRRRSLFSISLWEDVKSIYSMGSVPLHIKATKLAARLGVATYSGVYCYAGDWRRVLFQSEYTGRSPLRSLGAYSRPTTEGGKLDADSNGSRVRRGRR